MFPIKGAISWGKFPMNHLKLRPQAAKDYQAHGLSRNERILLFLGKKTTGHDPSEEQQQKDLHETG